MPDFSDSLFRVLVDEAPEAICQADSDCVIRYANRSAVELFGAPDERALVGRWSYDLIVPSEHAFGRTMVERRMRGLRDRYETVARLYDGTVAVIRLSAVPLFANGAYAGSFSIITFDRDEARREPCEAGVGRELAVFEVDASSAVLSADASADRLLERRRLTRRDPLRSLVRDEDRGRFDQALARALEGASTHSVILDLSGPGERRQPAQWSFSAPPGGGAARAAPVARVAIGEIEAPGPRRRLPDAAFYASFALSNRERDVLDLLVMGHRYKEIAWRLGLGLPTVRTHVMSAYRKTGVHSTEELLRLISRI